MHWCAEWANGLKLFQELESAFNACVVTTTMLLAKLSFFDVC